MQIDDFILIIQNLISYTGKVTYKHPDYRKFHDGITAFVMENKLEQTEEWKKIKTYLLIKSTQHLTNQEANIILENLEEIKRIVLRTRVDESQDRMIFNSIIHPLIKHVSRDKYFSGFYADSVECAFKEINSRLKKIYRKHKKEELDGADLMHTIFNYRNENQRLLTFESLDTETGRSVQEGYMHIFAGAMQAIRNPKAHDNVILSKEDAMDRLIFASLLMKKIDEALLFSKMEE
jgi:uncharacterized protein (TIGR02391 family)